MAMKKLVGGLLASVLASSSVPPSAWAQFQAAAAGVSGAPVGAGAQAGASLSAGASPALGFQAAPAQLSFGPSPLAPIGSSPKVRAAPPARTSSLGIVPARGLDLPAALPVSAGRETAAASAAVPEKEAAAAATLKALPSPGADAGALKSARKTTKSLGPDPKAGAAPREKGLAGLPDASSDMEVLADLDETFDGTGKRKGLTQSRAAVQGRSRPGRVSGLGDSSRTGRSPAVEKAAEAVSRAVESAVKPLPPEKPEKQGFWKRIRSYPKSYYQYLYANFIYVLGQEAAALVTPLFAYASGGLAFAFFAQGVSSVGQILGSAVAANWVKKHDSKTVYLWAYTAKSLSFLMLPVVFVLSGSVLPGIVFPVYLIAFKTAAGFIYGALRGVAEKEITTRIFGKRDKDKLKEAGALFYAVFEGAELVAALGTGLLLAVLGHSWTAGIMAALMMSSLIPLKRVKLRSRGEVEEEDKIAGTEKSLPWKLYLPFVFSFLMHIALYDFFAPFIGLEVFSSESMGSFIIGSYTLGSLLVALFTWAMPEVTAKLTEKHWTAAGIALSLAFLYGSILIPSMFLSLALAVLLGVGVTSMQIQWRAVYQRRLAQDAQPKVFNWLNIWSVIANIAIFAVVQGGILFTGLSMGTLLLLVAGLMTFFAAVLPGLSYLRKRAAGKPRPEK